MFYFFALLYLCGLEVVPYPEFFAMHNTDHINIPDQTLQMLYLCYLQGSTYALW